MRISDWSSDGALPIEDRNGNGQRDGGEPGLAGVKLIINERAVVLSGADGTARLPVQGADRIAVVKPPGYGLPRRDNGLPDFWRRAANVGEALDIAFGLRRSDAGTAFDEIGRAHV